MQISIAGENALIIYFGDPDSSEVSVEISAQIQHAVHIIRRDLHDVVIDLRDGSATFGHSFATELSAENRRMLYVPKGFAHGFLTLEPDTEALYFVDEFYAPERERVIRWNDPLFGIEWPSEPVVLSDKDRTQSDFDPAHPLMAKGAEARGIAR